MDINPPSCAVGWGAGVAIRAEAKAAKDSLDTLTRQFDETEALVEDLAAAVTQTVTRKVNEQNRIYKYEMAMRSEQAKRVTLRNDLQEKMAEAADARTIAEEFSGEGQPVTFEGINTLQKMTKKVLSPSHTHIPSHSLFYINMVYCMNRLRSSRLT